MAITLDYPNARAVAHGVSGELESRGVEPLMPLPYNRFNKMDTSTWWVNPSKENPAYKHGKYAFVPELGGHGDFFCGLHVEKGFGPSVALLMTSAKTKRLLMRDDWLWHQFVSDLAAAKLDEPVREMVKGVGGSVRILVQAYYCKDFSDGDFDPYETGDDWDQVEFSADGRRIALDEDGTRTSSGLLTDAARAKSLEGLGGALASVPTHEWVWINFWLGHGFALDSGRRTGGHWTGAQLYDDLLKPLRPWFA